MAITNFVQVEFNRAIQEELFDIKFIDFGEGSVIVFILVKTCISYGNNRMFISEIQGFKEVCICYCFIPNSHIVVMQYFEIFKAYSTSWLTNLIDKF